MTPLADLLTAQIARSGPITLADYMAECLLHPVHGYYSTRDPFGAAGDFVTAPEISQMFGELIGLCLAQAWMDQGQPARFALAEMGPGRGTLMADLWRATSAVPGFHAAAEVHFVEASPVLRAAQAERIPHGNWHNDVSSLPDLPLFMIANEFFDALPIRQFQRAEAGWSERVVRLEGDKLAFGLTSPAPVAALEHRLSDTKPGDLVETCAPGQAVAEQVGLRVAAHGGAALFIDYGDWRSLGDTFQAVASHQPVDPLASPGEADLTAQVDFEALAKAATQGSTARYSRLTQQGVFLERLGITSRAEALATRLSGAAMQTHIAAHRRLTHPAEMGHLFKVIGITPDSAQPPPGLDP